MPYFHEKNNVYVILYKQLFKTNLASFWFHTDRNILFKILFPFSLLAISFPVLIRGIKWEIKITTMPKRVSISISRCQNDTGFPFLQALWHDSPLPLKEFCYFLLIPLHSISYCFFCSLVYFYIVAAFHLIVLTSYTVFKLVY